MIYARALHIYHLLPLCCTHCRTDAEKKFSFFSPGVLCLCCVCVTGTRETA
uniref:Uncharacterized protein n=1 Tax=Anopheles dirus TaxID=7168 RepID=A0A182NY35_9DIPT